MTQLQWGLVQTGRVVPSYYKNQEDRAMRPVESVCYNEIRTGAANVTTGNPAYDWPADPNPASFLGLLRKKTGIDFDLPSETQWEFAARAGNGATKWGNGACFEVETVPGFRAIVGQRSEATTRHPTATILWVFDWFAQQGLNSSLVFA